MLEKFQDFLYQSIPLTKNMGLEFIEYNGNALQIKAPLSNNINDKGSVFGGSSSALMIIAGWSLININCDENEIDSDIVIHKNETIWQKALYSDLYIQVEFKREYNFESIKTIIDKKRHQKIDCQIYLKDKDGDVFSTMTAKYVIIPK